MSRQSSGRSSRAAARTVVLSALRSLLGLAVLLAQARPALAEDFFPDEHFGVGIYVHDVSTQERGVTDDPHVYLAIWGWCTYGALGSVEVSEDGGPWVCPSTGCYLMRPGDYTAYSDWTLTGGEGVHTLEVRLHNSWNETTVSTAKVMLDQSPPRGAVFIANDAPATPSRDVSLVLELADTSGVAMFGLRNGGSTGFQWYGAPPDAALVTSGYYSYPWQLGTGDGEHTVELVVRDYLGHESPVYSDRIVLDTRPIQGTVQLPEARVAGDGHTYVSELLTPIAVTAQGAVTSFKLKNSSDADFPALAYTYPASPFGWELAAGADGPRTVDLALLDWQGATVASASTSAILDREPPTCVLTIDNGGDSTRAAVDLVLASTDTLSGVETMCFRYDARGEWTQCQPYASRIPWVLETDTSYGEGLYDVSLEALVTDRAGNGRVCSDTVSLLVDASAPTGFVGVVTDGSIYVPRREVQLTLTAHDDAGVQSMRLANDADPWPATWTPFARGAAWTLSAGDGEKVVRAQFRDFAGHESPVYQARVRLDTQPPAGTLFIEGGVTTTTSVVLQTEATDGGGSGVSHVRFRNDGGVFGPWLDHLDGFAETTPWVLPAGDGTKTVHAQFRDRLGFVGPEVSATVVLEADPPVGTLVINGGDELTRSKEVMLTVWANDPSGAVTEMRFDGGDGLWSPAEPYPAGGGQRAWTLYPSLPDGTKTVRVQYRSGGPWSEPQSDTIVIDQTRPAACAEGGIVIDGGAARTGVPRVMLALCASDAGSGVAQMRLRNYDLGEWSAWEPFASAKEWLLIPNATAWDLPKTVYLELMDVAGNVTTCTGGPSCSASIRLDTQPPSGTIRIQEAADCPTATNACVRTSVVHLVYDVTDAAGITTMRFRDSTLEPWLELAFFDDVPLPWELPAVDGRVVVYAEFEDAVGNVAALDTGSLALDVQGPVGSIVIDGGADYAASNTVALTVGASDRWRVPYRRFKDSLAAPWPAYETWNSTDTTRPWTFAPGDGPRTVWVQYRDTWENESAVYEDSIFLDTVAPSLSLGAGGAYTATGVVTLTLAASDAGSGVAEMRVRNTTGTWSAWEPFAETRSWALDGGTGEKSVEVEVRDRAGNVQRAAATLFFDADPPQGSLLIDGGALVTSDTEVTLAIAATDAGSGLAEQSLRNDEGEWTAWEPFATSRGWTLSPWLGERTVSVRFRDVAGRVGEPCSARILYDTAPVASAGGPYRLPLGSDVSLDAAASTDADLPRGDELTHAWDLDGDGVFGERTGETVVLAWAELEQLVCGGACEPERAYPLAVQVTDRWQLTAVAASSVTLHENLPRARARALPEPTPCREPVTFDASLSTHDNPELHPALYEWDLGYDGTFTAEATGVTAVRTYHRFGVQRVALRVTDDNTPPATDLVVLEVLVDAGNEAPVAVLDGPLEVRLGRGATLDASGSYDANAAIQWRACDGIVAHRWDLNGDGLYDDAAGDRLQLTADDLEELVCGGACVPGFAYPVAVEVQDTLATAGAAGTTVTFVDPEPLPCGDGTCAADETPASCPLDCDHDSLGVAWGASPEWLLPSGALAGLGVRNVALELHWDDVTTPGGERDWTVLDAWLARLESDEVALLRISTSPHLADYAFFHDVAARAATKVRYFESEPRAYEDPYFRADAYAELVRVFHRAVKDAAPSAVVVLGAMDPEAMRWDWLAEVLFELATDAEPQSFDMIGLTTFGRLYPYHDALRRLHAAFGAYPEHERRPFVVSAYGGPILQHAELYYGGEIAALLSEAAADPCVLSATRPDLPDDVRMFTYELVDALEARRDRLQAREQVQRTLGLLATGARKVFWHGFVAEEPAACTPRVFEPQAGKLRLADFDPTSGALLPRPALASYQRMVELLGEPVRVRRLASEPQVWLYEVTRADAGKVLVLWAEREPFVPGTYPPLTTTIAVPFAEAAVIELFAGPLEAAVADGVLTLELTDTPVFVVPSSPMAGAGGAGEPSPGEGSPPSGTGASSPPSGTGASSPPSGTGASLEVFEQHAPTASGCSAQPGGSGTFAAAVLVLGWLWSRRRGARAQEGRR